MNLIGNFEEKPFPKGREMAVDVVELGLRKHHMKGNMEVDITKAREYIRNYKRSTGVTLSFTAWVIKCIAQAVSEHKQIHALRKGKHKIIVFDDVDTMTSLTARRWYGSLLG